MAFTAAELWDCRLGGVTSARIARQLAIGVAAFLTAATIASAEPPSPRPRPPGRSLEDLVEDLGRQDPRARMAAARGLAVQGDRAAPAVTELAAALEDEDHLVRLEVARALRAVAPHTRDAIPALVRALDDRFSDVRVECAYAIGAIGPDAKPAVPALTKLLSDRHARRAAAWSLGNIGPGARDALVPLERARDGESDAQVREELTWALERVRWREPARGGPE